MSVTNRGKFNILNVAMRGLGTPANFYLALCTNTNPPTIDTNTFSELSEIAIGNGYADSGGAVVARDGTDWDTLTENDTTDLALVRLKDFSWTASGGSIPASGSGARWAVLLGPNATVGAREVWAYWSLGSDRTVSTGQTLTIQDCEIDATE